MPTPARLATSPMVNLAYPTSRSKSMAAAAIDASTALDRRLDIAHNHTGRPVWLSTSPPPQIQVVIQERCSCNNEICMYISAVDRSVGEREWRPFVEHHGFGHLVAAGRDREIPVVVPTQFVLDADEVLLHLVAANPIFDALAEQPRVVLSVAGDWAFIPSAWKAIGVEDPRLGIPTTYYAAVQLVGTARVGSDPASVAEVLRRQVAVLQPEVSIADPADAHGAKLGAIRAVTITVDEVRAKFKYGGNVDDAHRRAVVERLRERSGPGDVEAAAHAERRGRYTRSAT